MSEQKGGQMKDDLDFDELHQAVSKLMDQAAKPKPRKAPESTPAPKPAVAAAQPQEEQLKKQPAVAADAGEGIQVVVKRLTPAAPIVMPKRKGMAMDMVVQPKGAPEPPSARTGRTGQTLQPTQKVVPEKPVPTAVAPKVAEADVSDDTLASLNLQADAPKPDNIHAPTFPDPLDVHGFSDDEDDKPAPAPQPTMQHTASAVEPSKPAEKHAEEGGAAEKAEAPSMVSSETPFLNAKVEKRPLGAFADADQKPAETAEAKSTTSQPADTSETPNQRQPETVQAPPKEFSPEVVAVESSEQEFAPNTPSEQAQANMEDLRQMAIPQQYKTGEKQSNQDTRPVFDTKNYHPPLRPTPGAHRPSRAGGLFTLVLIILVVIAAVGAYFFTVGGLDITKFF